jgi:hypothetical protein
MGRRYLKSCEPGYRPRTRLEIPRGAVSDRYPLDILSLVRSLVVPCIPGVPGGALTGDPWWSFAIPGIARTPRLRLDSPAAPLGIFCLSFYLSYGGRPARLDKPLWMSCFTKKQAAYCRLRDIRNFIPSRSWRSVAVIYSHAS